MEIGEDRRSTIPEVQGLLDEAEKIGLETPEIKALGLILDHAVAYRDKVRGVLAKTLESDDVKQEAISLLDMGATLEVHVEEFDILERRLAEMEWWQNASELVDKEFVEHGDVCDMVEDGRDIGIRADEPLYARLRKMRSAGEQWRIDALKVTKSRSVTMEELRNLESRTRTTPSIKDLRNKVRETIDKVSEWRGRARNLLAAAAVDLPPLDAEDTVKVYKRGARRSDSELDEEGVETPAVDDLKTPAAEDSKPPVTEEVLVSPRSPVVIPAEEDQGREVAPATVEFTNATTHGVLHPNDDGPPPGRTVFAEEVRTLLAELSDCPVKPPELGIFKEQLRLVDDWVNRAKKTLARRDRTLRETLEEIQSNLINGIGDGEGLFCLCRTADEGFMASVVPVRSCACLFLIPGSTIYNRSNATSATSGTMANAFESPKRMPKGMQVTFVRFVTSMLRCIGKSVQRIKKCFD